MKYSKLQSIIREEISRHIKLLEYGNEGPSTPEVYILDIKNKKTSPSSIDEIKKVSNLVYDMGGGETSYYDEYNVVIVDNLNEKEVFKGVLNNSDAEKKIFIKFNLENSYSFPQANNIIISQLVYHLKNIENFAKTVNNSLKPNGKVNFFSDKMFKIDKQFIKILVEKYNFHLPDNIELQDLSKYKDEDLVLQRGKPHKTPPIVLKFKIKNTETGDEGFIKYEKTKKGWEETIEGNIPKEDFYIKGKPMIWQKHALDKNSKRPIFIKSPEYSDNPKAWYWKDYPLRFKYEFVK